MGNAQSHNSHAAKQLFVMRPGSRPKQHRNNSVYTELALPLLASPPAALLSLRIHSQCMRNNSNTSSHSAVHAHRKSLVASSSSGNRTEYNQPAFVSSHAHPRQEPVKSRRLFPKRTNTVAPCGTVQQTTGRSGEHVKKELGAEKSQTERVNTFAFQAHGRVSENKSSIQHLTHTGKKHMAFHFQKV
jgi:hypothetical protein